MSLFVASETESLFETFLSLLWGEFLDFHDIDIHGIGVFSCFGRGREELEGLGRLSASLGNLFRMVPLVLEMDHF